MVTQTANYGLSLPAVNDPADEDLWGNELNTNTSSLDALLKTALGWATATETASFAVTAPTAGSSATGSSKTFYSCNASLGAMSGSLPAAATCAGLTVGFAKSDNSANAVTVQANGAELIGQSNTVILSAQDQYLFIFSDGTKWRVFSASMTNSPALTGTPTAPTAPDLNNSTQLATTAFVQKGAAQAYVNFDANGSIVSSFNVSNVTRTSTGNFNINFSNVFADANYIVMACAGSNTGGSPALTVNPINQTTSLVTLQCYTSNTAVLTNPTRTFLVIYGV